MKAKKSEQRNSDVCAMLGFVVYLSVVLCLVSRSAAQRKMIMDRWSDMEYDYIPAAAGIPRSQTKKRINY